MPDSITSWRVTSLANTLNGALGSDEAGIIVFQEFFVDIDFPVFLTQNDEVSVPVGIYNYLPEAQTISLTAEENEWFEKVGDLTVDVEVLCSAFGVRRSTLDDYRLAIGNWRLALITGNRSVS